ncbi:MAG: ATP-dependent DNA helicase RecG [Aeromonadales bacterium]|nr:ATP-dependent DNA helicase RecG [Aeromonadales bacterium]
MAFSDDTFYSSTDITTLKGLGPSYTKSFYKKGFYNLFDLLLDFPFKYLDQTKISPIASITPDGRYYFLDAHITRVQLIQKNRMNILKVHLMDTTGTIEAVFFNLYANQIKNYVNGARVLAFGPVKRNNYNNSINITQPTITFLNEDDIVETQDRMTPVYHAVEKVPQASIRKTINGILQNLKAMPMQELLPAEHNPFKLSFNEALDLVHYPYPLEDPKAKFLKEKTDAFKRICFEELIAYQLTLLSLKKKNINHKSISLKKESNLISDFLKSLPFTLTNAQLRSFNEISQDLEKDIPMLRLLHGDVGTGKTLVAVLACLQATASKQQCVLLAPTELLAMQHFKKIDDLLKNFGIKTVLITSSVKGSKRTEILEQIKSGEAQVIVGTHSVFQAEVNYHSLALAIIDEQHRFGLDQRLSLLRKAPSGINLHQLVMTATPIPRTLQLALFSDLDVSSLDELPKGRKPIVTAVVSEDKKADIYARLREVCTQGTQVYWVCPNIEETEDDNSSVKTAFKDLKKALPNLKIALLHGQLSSTEKQKIMKGFLEGEYNILVSTTIIEVGVDVPNASIIIIESANKLGLAQLHQLRGRVGRGAKESYCILMYQKKEDDLNPISMQRLNIMKSTNDGFKIATEDLKLRGPGEVLGQKQTGFDLFRIVDVNRDFELIDDARKAAIDIINNDETNTKALITRWFPGFKV